MNAVARRADDRRIKTTKGDIFREQTPRGFEHTRHR